MKISIKSENIKKIKADMVVVGIFEGQSKLSGKAAELDPALGGLIKRLVSKKELTGKTGSSAVLHTSGKIASDHVLVIGLGKSEELDLDRIRMAASTAIKNAKKIKARSLVYSLDGQAAADLSPFDICRAMVEASVLQEHEFAGYKSENEDDTTSLEELVIIENNSKRIPALRAEAARAQTVAGAVNKAKDLVSAPSNRLTPMDFASTARKVAAGSRLSFSLLRAKDIRQKGMGALWAIAKGSSEEPCVVVLKYKSAGRRRSAPIALIGKGITFDSGGISLKPSKKMDEMKTDMAGAAAVLYAMEAIAKLKADKDVIAVIPLCENMPGGRALKPGDVVTSMSGKTMEIISTDAEGRMILADAITYAKKLGAGKMIDIATLTGACVVALGDLASGILGNNQMMIDDLITAAERSGERLWQLPLYKEYREYLKSGIADIKNCSDLGKAGTSSGATFLKEFVEDTPWAHIDIAGTAYLDRTVRHYRKGASGAGVFTVANYILGR